MLASRRWRDWNPPAISEEGPERELTKPTEALPSPILSVLSVPSLPVSEINTPSDSDPPHDPAEWREPFTRWLDSACVLHPRVFGAVALLHIAFCKWGDVQGGDPCDRETFERLLTEQGLLIGEVAGTVLVNGVAFREDVEAAGL